MILKNIFLFSCLIITISCTQEQPKVQFTYPTIVKEIVTDTIGSTLIVDPYRNLENLKDTEILDWFKNQGKLTDSILHTINSENHIYNELIVIENAATDNDDIIQNSLYGKDGEFYVLKRAKNEEISKLYHRKHRTAEDVLVFDPASIGPDLTINYTRLSRDYNNIAISLAPAGVTPSTLIILDLLTNTILPHRLTNVAPQNIGGLQWLPDHSGFYYLQFSGNDPKEPSYLENTKAFLHYINTPQSQDIEVFSKTKTPEIALTPADFPIVQTRRKNPDVILGRVSGNSPYKDIYYSKITSKTSFEKPQWKPLFKQSDQIDQYFIVKDTLFYRTSKEASNFKICKARIGSDYSEGKILVDQLDNTVITDFEVIGSDIYYIKVTNGVRVSLVHLSNSKTQNIPLPYASGDSFINTTPTSDLYTGTSGWTQSWQTYIFRTKTQEFEQTNLSTSKYPEIFNKFIIEEVEVTSHDGAKVPLSIIRHPDSKLNGTNRVKIVSYGAYGSTFSPYFSIDKLNWVASGNIFAIPHVRGGGERGDAWHKGGFKTTKSNSWKDYIACTEYLIDHKYTNPDLTIASAGSAGGLVIANAIVERPDLYKVAISYSGFINATRSEFQANGANSIKEFGTLSIPEEAQGLIDMDVYLKVKENVAYPAFYAFVGLEDGAVAAWDSAKFVARLQNDSATTNPVLLKIDEDAGHSGGGTQHAAYQIYSDADAFALWQTGHPDYQPKEE